MGEYMGMGRLPQRGKMLERAWELYSGTHVAVAFKIDSPQAEVYFAPKYANIIDEPEFHMYTDDNVLIKFALSGDMTSMHKITESGLETVIEMDNHYRFHLHRNALPVNGVVDNPGLAPEQLLESLIDYAYRKAKAAKETGVKERGAEDFEVLTHEAIVARFKLFQLMQSPEDIIPDQSPRTIVVKAGDGCPYSCAYCPESKIPFKPYTAEEFENNLRKVKESMVNMAQQNGLSDNLLTNIDQGFINISDILLLDKLHKTDLTAKKAVQLMKEYFPWIEKLGSFVGTKSVLDLSRRNKPFLPEKQFYEYNFTSGYLEELREAGLNRLYLGIETAHDEGSRILNKPITNQEKLLAAYLIKQANIGLKAIVQIGVLGSGFYPEEIGGRFVSSEEAIAVTAQWLNLAKPYRVYTSVWQNYGNLPINSMINEGRILPYTDPKKIEEERKLLTGLLKLGGNGKNPLETDYEKFLPCERKLVIPRD